MLTTGWTGVYQVGDTETFIISNADIDQLDHLTRCQVMLADHRQTQTMHAITLATGGVLHEHPGEDEGQNSIRYLPLICGGIAKGQVGNDKCYQIDLEGGGLPAEVGVMREMRNGAASIVIVNGTTLWVTGGQFGTATDTTEWISTSMMISQGGQPPSTPTKLQQGPHLPMQMTHHCLERINAKTAILFGGDQFIENVPGLRLAWTINGLDSPDFLLSAGGGPTSSWTLAPPMKHGRFAHGCGVLRAQGSNTRRKFIVAAGGEDVLYSESTPSFATKKDVELLRVDEDENGNVVNISDAWEEGPPLATTLAYMASATTEDQSILFLVGGLVSETPSNYYSNYIWSLRCITDVCWWRWDTTERLLIARDTAVAFIIPPLTTPPSQVTITTEGMTTITPSEGN